MVFPGQRQQQSQPGPAPEARCSRAFRTKPGGQSPIWHSWLAALWACARLASRSWSRSACSLAPCRQLADGGQLAPVGSTIEGCGHFQALRPGGRERHPTWAYNTSAFQAGAGMSPHRRQERHVAGSSLSGAAAGASSWDGSCSLRPFRPLTSHPLRVIPAASPTPQSQGWGC